MRSNLIMGYSVSQLCHWDLEDFESLIEPLDWFVLEEILQTIEDDREGTEEMAELVSHLMEKNKPQFCFLQSGHGVHHVSRLCVEWEHGNGMTLVDHDDPPVLIGREGEPLQDHLRKYILDQIGEEAHGITCRLFEAMPEKERAELYARLRAAYSE